MTPEHDGRKVMRGRILVTGVTGFIGMTLARRITRKGYSVMGAVRRRVEGSIPFEPVVVGQIGRATEWADALAGVAVVVHAAARVHVVADTEQNPLDAYREVNVEGTRRLAEQAAAVGVNRFVFLSSVKVNGEETTPGSPFRSDDAPAPEGAYGQSKWEAEQALMEVAERTAMEVVIIRPPLVYGAGVKGNFATMMSWIAKGVPLPLGALDNRRSLVALDNLVDLISVCIDHPAAANQVFLAGDGADLSTTNLLRRVAKAMDRSALLMPVPPSLLKIGAVMLGKGDMARRLLGSLQVDISKTRDVLDWEPPISVDEGLRRAVEPRMPCGKGLRCDE